MQCPTNPTNPSINSTGPTNSAAGNNVCKQDSKNKNKKTADNDLKNSIINFIQERPFLWDACDPLYKDLRRRDQEFLSFSQKLGLPVQEIKRVWHVLRTNFFRAHKLLSQKGLSGRDNAKLWRYYQSMKFILQTCNDSSACNPATNYVASRSPSRSSSCKRVKRGSVEADVIDHSNSNSSNHSCGGPTSGRTSDNTLSSNTSSSGVASDRSIDEGRISQNSSCNINDCRNLGNCVFSEPARSGPTVAQITFDDSSSNFDDDTLYVRSLTSTLNRFDQRTKEMIKLKFQKIIVSYLQQSVPQTRRRCTSG